jgi:hypothetical protein
MPHRPRGDVMTSLARTEYAPRLEAAINEQIKCEGSRRRPLAAAGHWQRSAARWLPPATAWAASHPKQCLPCCQPRLGSVHQSDCYWLACQAPPAAFSEDRTASIETAGPSRAPRAPIRSTPPLSVELTVSYIYTSLAAFFDRDNVGLPGFSAYFRESR